MKLQASGTIALLLMLILLSAMTCAVLLIGKYTYEAFNPTSTLPSHYCDGHICSEKK